jgi:protein-tyrosine phosphatase
LVAVLFVCTGNICRSPTAEGVMRKLVAERGYGERIVIDSAGTHGYHEGEPPDPRSIEAALQRGVDLSAQRARRIREGDFSNFDLILAMDRGHARILSRSAPRHGEARIAMFLDYAPHLGASDVPDPYYGGEGGFELVLDMAEAAAAGLLEAIEQEYLFD